MIGSIGNGARRTASTLVAIAIVSLDLLAIDQGHIAALPGGFTANGEPKAVTLPEIEVTATRMEY